MTRNFDPILPPSVMIKWLFYLQIHTGCHKSTLPPSYPHLSDITYEWSLTEEGGGLKFPKRRYVMCRLILDSQQNLRRTIILAWADLICNVAQIFWMCPVTEWLKHV